jgi:hypothetical protein
MGNGVMAAQKSLELLVMVQIHVPQLARLAQRRERLFCNQEVVGSIPTVGLCLI